MLQRLRENRRILTFLAVFFLTLWFSKIFFTVQHESTHREVCRTYGGENVTTSTNYSLFFTSGETFCSNNTSGEGMRLQMQTWVVGYHVEAQMYTVFFGVLT